MTQATAVAEHLLYLRIPMRLVSEANQREHWAKKAARVKSQRATVSAHLFATKKRPAAFINAHGPLDVEITRVAPRSLDGDNCSSACKATRDAVAAWLMVDDRHDERVRYIVAQRKEPKTYAVEIRIARRVTA